jgi:hypothetical protein
MDGAIDPSRASVRTQSHRPKTRPTIRVNDPTVKTIVNDSFLAGMLRQAGGGWLFSNMTAGPSSPLSFDTYYFPIP